MGMVLGEEDPRMGPPQPLPREKGLLEKLPKQVNLNSCLLERQATRGMKHHSPSVILRKWGHSPSTNLKEPSEAQGLYGFWWPQFRATAERQLLQFYSCTYIHTYTHLHAQSYTHPEITAGSPQQWKKTLGTIYQTASYMTLTHQKTGTSRRLVIFPTSLSTRHLKAAEFYHPLFWSIIY